MKDKHDKIFAVHIYWFYDAPTNCKNNIVGFETGNESLNFDSKQILIPLVVLNQIFESCEIRGGPCLLGTDKSYVQLTRWTRNSNFSGLDAVLCNAANLEKKA